MIDYILIRKPNKRMYLRIKDGQVVVTAPRNVPKREIDAFMNKNASWIEKHLNEPKKGLCEGDVLHLFDRDVQVHFANQDPEIVGNKLILPKSQNALNRFILDYVQKTFQERLMYYARIMHEDRLKLKLAFYKSKWGSCTPSKRLITLNLNLAYSDIECIDAVVVHELAHLRVMNHSAKFYAIVESVLPDYRLRMKRLKAYNIPYIEDEHSS